ncbi:MAG TPA: proton-conducting transporter membrane subunit [Candidatus Omnitrophota bacterium]|nr:proton-conducting transporter membrane subunit [Candidatus Omnitrophota bacterium]
MDSILRFPWHVPFGELFLKLDPLNALFLAAVAVLVACSSVYGIGYMRQYKGRKPLYVHVFFYVLLAASFVTVLLANNAILFLCAWETMSISTYFLIVFNDERSAARKAGFLYFIVAHSGTFCLFLMFLLMAQVSGTMNFDVISNTKFSSGLSGIIFILALMGFGVKAGFLPGHFWLPHAHPEAPSHVSALLSGIAIKTGIYGICRVLYILGVLPVWCGYLVLFIGVIAGLMGVLYALGQHELKKLLAYHSIENIGIITIGLGLGLIGKSCNQPYVSVLGFSGALFHVINHALFKGLLFLDAGAVIQRTKTGEIDRLGGVAKIMPLVSVLFLVGALSICGIPLFNGFMSEFLIYLGLFNGLFCLSLNGVVSCVIAILALALMGALALACFTKVYGSVFLGIPRETFPPQERPSSKLMLAPMMILAGICIWIGIAPWTVAHFTFCGGEYLSRIPSSTDHFSYVMGSLPAVIMVLIIFIAVASFLAFMKYRVSRGTLVTGRATWNCGYPVDSPKFQYTSSSFASSIVEYFKSVLFFKRHGERIDGYFPRHMTMHSGVKDFFEDSVFRPMFAKAVHLSRAVDKKNILFTQMYLMYIFIFLIFLMLWKLRG